MPTPPLSYIYSVRTSCCVGTPACIDAAMAERLSSANLHRSATAAGRGLDTLTARYRRVNTPPTPWRQSSVIDSWRTTADGAGSKRSLVSSAVRSVWFSKNVYVRRLTLHTTRPSEVKTTIFYEKLISSDSEKKDMIYPWKIYVCGRCPDQDWGRIRAIGI